MPYDLMLYPCSSRIELRRRLVTVFDSAHVRLKVLENVGSGFDISHADV